VSVIQASTAAPLASPAKRSYGQILKSSALIGGSSILSVGFGIVRNKAIALILGPSGVGLFGLYNSVYDLTRSFAGLGVNSSGVRQIAEAVGSQNEERISRTVSTLRRVAFATGILGAALLVLFRRQISLLTFGTEAHANAVALLGVAVFFADISAGQIALVQGMRRIADLARINVLGAFFGTVLGVPIIYAYKKDGVVPSLVAVAGMSILTSWWYARRVKVQPSRMPLRELIRESSSLLRLGLVFMCTSMMTLGVGYLVRIMVVRGIDLDAAGYYQAAWNLGGFYFGFVLQAKGADF
jgi:antigen flippase